MRARVEKPEDLRKSWGWACLALQVVSIQIMSILFFHRMVVMNTVTTIMALDAFSMLILCAIYLSLLRGQNNHEVEGWLLLSLTVLFVALFIDFLFGDYFRHGIALTMFCGSMAILVPIFLSLNYCYFVRSWAGEEEDESRENDTVLYVIVGIGIALIIGNIFGGYYFRVDARGIREFSGNVFVCMAVPIMIMLVGLFMIFRANLSRAEKVVLISTPVFPIITMFVIRTSGDYRLITMGFVCSLVFLYTNLYLKRNEELMARRNALVMSELTALRLQINPHFIYNTLASISGLCEEEPEKAEKIIGEFSKYLRDNLSTDAKDAMISLETELQNINHYVYIEQIRFPNISVDYDMDAVNFKIPAMTLQPLVENAIHHGVCKRKRSEGLIRISSRMTENDYIVTVYDNGVGFDEKALNDGRKHTGIENVRNRLKLLCGGQLNIRSITGYGTTCEIMIPRDPDKWSERR